MKNKLFLPGIFSIFLIFNLTLISCPNGSTDNEEVTTLPELETGIQIYQKDGTTTYTGNGTVKIHYWVSDSEGGKSGEEFYVNAGTITDGKLTLALPSTIAEEHLSIMSEGVPETITISPSDAKGVEVSLRLFEEETEKGYLELGKIVQSGSVETYDRIDYMYFAKSVSINGTVSEIYSEKGEEYAYSESYQINGKAGWNRIYVHGSEDETSENNTYKTDLSGVPGDLKWILDTGK
jgi:hypothetical protein